MHQACIKKFFGTSILPLLDYTIGQLDQLALQIIKDQTIVTESESAEALQKAEEKLIAMMNSFDYENQL